MLFGKVDTIPFTSQPPIPDYSQAAFFALSLLKSLRSPRLKALIPARTPKMPLHPTFGRRPMTSCDERSDEQKGC
jgi:hypothetical protein